MCKVTPLHFGALNLTEEGETPRTGALGTVWMADYNDDTMYRYDRGGELFRSVNLEEGIGIWDLEVKQSGEVFEAKADCG